MENGAETKPEPGSVTINADGSATIDFSDMPIKGPGGEGEITSVTMREPRVSDQLAGDGMSPMRAEVLVIGNLCELPPEVVEALTIQQYGRLQDQYRVFMS